MNRSTVHILEILWLIAGILSLGAGMHQTIKEGFARSWVFLVMALLAFAMYSLRRNYRKKSNKNISGE